MDPDPDPGVPKTCGSGGSGFGSATLPGRRSSRPPTAPRPTPGPQWTAGEILAKYKKWMIYSLVVRASDCQCWSSNSPGFDPSILQHSGIWEAAYEAVLNIHRKQIQKIPLFLNIKSFVILTNGTEQCRMHVYKAVLGYENSRIPRLSAEDPQSAMDQCGPGSGIVGQCGSGSSSGSDRIHIKSF